MATLALLLAVTLSDCPMWPSPCWSVSDDVDALLVAVTNTVPLALSVTDCVAVGELLPDTDTV